jgi:hypothetical protein
LPEVLNNLLESLKWQDELAAQAIAASQFKDEADGRLRDRGRRGHHDGGRPGRAVDPDEGVGKRGRVLQRGVGNQPDTLGRDIGGAFADQRDTGIQALSELASDLDFAETGGVRIGSRHREEDGQHDATDDEDRTSPLSRATGRFTR